MVIDLKVLVRSFIAKAVHVMLETLAQVFCRVREIIICKGLPPTGARGPAGEGHQRMRVAVAKFPKVRLCESQTPRPLVFAFPSVHPC